MNCFHSFIMKSSYILVKIIVMASFLLFMSSGHNDLYPTGKGFERAIEPGKQQYSLLQKQSSFDECFKEAVRKLENGCKDLEGEGDHQSRNRLAISLTNCHLSKSGLRTYKCTWDMSIEECTRDMLASSIAFNTYTEFSTHVDNICFFIQSEIFHEKVTITVNSLISKSSEAVEFLNKFGQISHDIRELVGGTIEKQNLNLKLTESMGEKLHFLEQEEMQRFHKLNDQFNVISLISSELNEGLLKLQISQSESQKQNERFRNDTSQFMSEMKNGNKEIFMAISNTLDLSRDISNLQQILKHDVNSIHERQQRIGENIIKSLSNQDQLLLSQEEISSKQSEVILQTEHMFDTLKSSSEQLENGIQSSLRNQKHLFENLVEFSSNFEALKRDQERAFDQAKGTLKNLLQYAENTSDQLYQHHEKFLTSYSTLFSSLERIFDFQSLIFGEVFTFSSLFYYLCFIVVSFLITSAKQTCSARIWIFAILIINILTEKILICHVFRNGHIWWFYFSVTCGRIFYCACSIVLLIVKFLTYRDYETKNHQLIKIVLESQEKLRNEISSFESCISREISSFHHPSKDKEHLSKSTEIDPQEPQNNCNRISAASPNCNKISNSRCYRVRYLWNQHRREIISKRE